MKTLSTILLLTSAHALLSQDLAELTRQELIADWQRAKAFTLEYIEAIPEDQVNFKATPEVRSFAEQILHLSQGTIGLCSNGTGKEPIYKAVNLEKQEELKTKENLVMVATEAYDFAIAGVQEMDMSKAGEIVTRGPFNVTRIGWVNKAFEHQTHHRGQCTVYLRLAGVNPPAARLF